MTTATIAPQGLGVADQALPLRDWVPFATATAQRQDAPQTVSDDFAGRFRSSRMVGNSLEELSSWRVTTARLNVAAALAHRLGGTPGNWLTVDSGGLEVLTDCPTVQIVLDGPNSITSALTLCDQKEIRNYQPSTTVQFRLAHAYNLGMFQFHSTSWEFAENIGNLDEGISDIKGAVLCNLSIELVEFTTRNGDMISFRKPAIELLGEYLESCD